MFLVRWLRAFILWLSGGIAKERVAATRSSDSPKVGMQGQELQIQPTTAQTQARSLARYQRLGRIIEQRKDSATAKELRDWQAERERRGRELRFHGIDPDSYK